MIIKSLCCGVKSKIVGMGEYVEGKGYKAVYRCPKCKGRFIPVNEKEKKNGD